MKRGEVWRVRIPPALGHAQTGERPAVILQDRMANLRVILRCMERWGAEVVPRSLDNALLLELREGQ